MRALQLSDISAIVRQAEEVLASGHDSSQIEQTLDAELSELEEATRQLRTARNAFRPLLRLPLETLGEIAEALASVWPASSGLSAA